MQGTDPAGGSIHRRLKTESEGQFVGGLFHYHAIKHLLNQMNRAIRWKHRRTQMSVKIGVVAWSSPEWNSGS
jgi:hypothetical protein